MKRLFQRVKDERGPRRSSGAGRRRRSSCLMGMAAFGTDLAWFYLERKPGPARRRRRRPGWRHLAAWPSPVTADGTAFDIALRNGYDNTVADVEVVPAGVPGEPNKLKVTIQRRGADVLRQDPRLQHHGRSRERPVAEYIPPLKLGSPDNQFGNSCDPEQPGCTGQANFWANIHGKWTDNEMGDAYSSWCTNANDNPACAQNAWARSTGYLYGIESGSSFTLQFNDIAFHNNLAGTQVSGDGIRTGDRGCEDWTASTAADCGPTMQVALYAPDPTPLDITDNALLCQATIPPLAQVAETEPYGFTAPDGQGCWTQSGSGLYVVQVRHRRPRAAVDRAGLNRYSVPVEPPVSCTPWAISPSTTTPAGRPPRSIWPKSPPTTTARPSSWSSSTPGNRRRPGPCR